jgi:hypothetical protein
LDLRGAAASTYLFHPRATITPVCYHNLSEPAMSAPWTDLSTRLRDAHSVNADVRRAGKFGVASRRRMGKNRIDYKLRMAGRGN